jgi:hypothetical protein
MSDLRDDSEKDMGFAAIKYGAWLLSLIIVLYFISRHVFPFIINLF